MYMLDKKQIEHLAKLARLELTAAEEKKYLADLEKILNHFQELQELNTDNVAPLTGGTELKSVFRADEINENRLSPEEATKAFPEHSQGYLKVPPVFSAEGGSPPERSRAGASGGE